MVKAGKIFGLIILCLFVTKCAENAENVEKEYSANGHFWKSKRAVNTSNSLDFVATEVPNEYYLMKHLELIEEDRRDSLMQSMSKERIIEFEIGDKNGEDLFENQSLRKRTNEAVKYLMSGISKDFKVITRKGDTIPCIGVHLEQAYNLKNVKRLLLYFDNIEEGAQIQLFYNDKLFGNGTMKFMFVNQPLKL